MEKKHILEEIIKTAKQNDGIPLGMGKFFKVTGIKMTDWRGRYWAKWSDAILEAGFTPNQYNQPYNDEYLIKKLIDFIRELKQFPTSSELKLKGHDDKGFPSHNVWRKYGPKVDLVSNVVEYCKIHAGFDDVFNICLPLLSSSDNEESEKDDKSNDENFGYVYLIKSGQYYKIGRSNSAGRRKYELDIQLPEKAKTIHEIQTDDPNGIEKYWHTRFEVKRKNGEWFDLDAKDVRAFKRWKRLV